MPLEYFITPKCHLLKTIHLFISFSESEILKEFSYMDLALTFHMTMHFISLRCSHLQGQQSWRSIFKDVYTLGDSVSLWLRAADLSFLHMVLNTCPSRLPFKKSMRIGNNSTTCLSCPALPCQAHTVTLAEHSSLGGRHWGKSAPRKEKVSSALSKDVLDIFYNSLCLSICNLSSEDLKSTLTPQIPI